MNQIPTILEIVLTAASGRHPGTCESDAILFVSVFHTLLYWRIYSIITKNRDGKNTAEKGVDQTTMRASL